MTDNAPVPADEIAARVAALEAQMTLVKQHLSNAGHPLPEATPEPPPAPEPPAP